MKKQRHIISQPEFYILLTLSIKRSHGYEIMKKVQQYSDNTIYLGPATLYSALKRMVEKKMIEETTIIHKDTRRKSYQLTPEGEKILGDEMERLQNNITLYKAQSYIAGIFYGKHI